MIQRIEYSSDPVSHLFVPVNDALQKTSFGWPKIPILRTENNKFSIGIELENRCLLLHWSRLRETQSPARFFCEFHIIEIRSAVLIKNIICPQPVL